MSDGNPFSGAGPGDGPKMARHWLTFLEHCNLLLCVVDIQGRFHWTNRAWQSLLGWTPEELAERRFYDLLHPDDMERTFERAQDHVRGLEATEFENRYLHRNGQYRRIRWQAGPAGEGARIFGIGRDITHEQQAQEERTLLLEIALRIGESEDLDSALEHVLASVCRHTDWEAAEAWLPTPDGEQLFCSSAWFGQGRAVQRGGESLGRFRSMAQELRFGRGESLPGACWELERPIWVNDVARDPDFQRSEMAQEAGLHSAVAIPVKTGMEVAGVLLFFLSEAREETEDLMHLITAVGAQIGSLLQRRRDQQVREGIEGRYRALTEHAVDAIVSSDESGRIVQFNPRAQEMFGYDAEEVLGHPLTVLMPDRYRQPHEDALQRYLRTGEATVLGSVLELEGKRKDGSSFPIELALSTWEERGKTQFGAIIRDITARRATERAARREARRTRLLRDVAVQANGSNDAEESLRFALDKVCEHTEWSVGHAYLLDPETGDLAPSGIWSRADIFEQFRKVTAKSRFATGEGLPGRVLEAGEAAWIEDIDEDHNFPRRHMASDLGLHGAFAIPILLNDEVLGVLEFYSEDIEVPDAELLDALEAVGAQLGRVLQRDDAYPWA